MDTHMTPMPAGLSAGIAESPAINELAAALARAQGAFSNPCKDRDNPFFGSRYATLGAVIKATRGPLADNGLSLTQTIGGGHGGRTPLLRTRLLHASGQWLASEVPLFAAGKGSQAFGSELTYMRRYAVCALLNIAPAEGDDDGNAAQAATGAPPARAGSAPGRVRHQRQARPCRLLVPARRPSPRLRPVRLMLFQRRRRHQRRGRPPTRHGAPRTSRRRLRCGASCVRALRAGCGCAAPRRGPSSSRRRG